MMSNSSAKPSFGGWFYNLTCNCLCLRQQIAAGQPPETLLWLADGRTDGRDSNDSARCALYTA